MKVEQHLTTSSGHCVPVLRLNSLDPPNLKCPKMYRFLKKVLCLTTCLTKIITGL